MINLRFSHKSRGRIVALIACFFLLSGLGFSTVYGASGAGGFRIFTVKRISAEQGLKYLSEAGIGSVSHLSGSASLLVTGSPDDVARAKVLLDLVDVQQNFAVKVMGSSLKAEILPASESIAEKLSGISVGTFASPPEEKDGSGAIVDIHNGSLLIVAQASHLERVVAAVGRLLKDKKDAAGPEESPAEPTTVEPKVDKIEFVRPADANSPRNGPTKPIPQQTVKAQTPGTGKTESPEKPADIYKPESVPGVGGKLTVSLPQNLDIVSLLQLAGEYLDLNFMYDPLKIKGEVTILWTGNQKGTIKVEELYPLMESVLQFHGFAMTRNPNANMVRVTPMADTVDAPLIEDKDDRITDYGNVIVTRIFKLEHIDATSAKNLLDGMKLGESSPVGDGKVLFVTGYAYRMPRVERLLEMIDKPGKPKKIRFRPCKFTMATALAPKVKALAEQLGTVSITVGQMATTPSTPSSSGRKPGESTADYSRRMAEERAARSGASTPRGSATPAAAGPGVYLDADERTNRVLMIGFDEELDSVEELIDALDVEQTDLRALKLYEIKNVDAEQARKKLQELGIVSGDGMSSSSSRSRITDRSSSTLVGAATRPVTSPATTPAGTVTMGGREGGLESLVGEPIVVIIEPTNSLLVNATAEQHVQIQLILKYVDAVTDVGTIPYVIYPLENQKPEDLAGILEKLIQETVKDKEGKIETVVKKTDEDIVIVPDENTFSIIVYASKRNQEWIKNLIETLDKRRPQVLIDVTLVEVSKGDSFEYDLNLIQSFPDLTETAGVVAPDANTIGSVINKLIKSTERDRYIDYQVESGAGTGFYGDRHVNALLNLMQKKDYGRIMAKPKILVNDNELGTISTTDTTYIEKRSSIPLSTAGGGTGVTTVTTAVDYQGYDAGIKLDITPHISEGQLLRLEITLTRSDFTGSTAGDKPPNTTATDIATIVTVPDGSTIILGGLEKLNQGKGGTKVPLLGDLPIVGGLFRSVNNSDLQKRTYIFIRAEIIRPAETLAQGLPDLEKISQRNRLAFEKFENEFQGYKSFPGMKSKPMQPAKVLDTE
jgi:general secretion pathway protein D